jgi:hypothetical protein
MDELSTVKQLLAEPLPGPEVVEAARLRLEGATLGRTPQRTRAAGRGGRTPGLVRRGAAPRRWPGWLAPVAAATAVVAVILGSLGISGVIGHRPAGTGAANSAGALAKVPPFFVAVPVHNRGRAVVGVTPTGAVLGTVAPLRPHTEFLWVTGAGDDRTFVLAAGIPPAAGTSLFDWKQVRFYRLTLGRSGHPGLLAALPIPAESATITGLSLSPDGSKLAVWLLGTTHPQAGPTIQVFSLATGTQKTWVWPDGQATIGQLTIGAGATPNVWEADNRTLLFEVTTSAADRWAGQLRLLDTATPGGSLPASSTRIPVPSDEVGWHSTGTHRIDAIPLISGDGTTFIAAFSHAAAPPKRFVFTITDFSTQTGKPVRILYQRRSDTDADATAVLWANTSGTAMIAIRPRPGQSPSVRGAVLGVQTPTTFTPFSPNTQRLLFSGDIYHRLPAW